MWGSQEFGALVRYDGWNPRRCQWGGMFPLIDTEGAHSQPAQSWILIVHGGNEIA